MKGGLYAGRGKEDIPFPSFEMEFFFEDVHHDGVCFFDMAHDARVAFGANPGLKLYSKG